MKAVIIIMSSTTFFCRAYIRNLNSIRRATHLRHVSSPVKLRSSVTNTNNIPLQPLVVCGPSGVGKGTIISRFMENKSVAFRFGFSVSHTTRQPRPGEIDGVHYHFVTRDVMMDKIKAGDFLEHAEVHGNTYGTSLQSVLDVSSRAASSSDSCGSIDGSDLNQQCLLDIDVEGVKSIKEFQIKQQGEKKFQPIREMERPTQQYTAQNDESLPEIEAKFIFIAPPSIDVLKDRLSGRGTETDEQLKLRTNNAQAELDYGLRENTFDAVVVNDDLDQACEAFARVVRDMYR